MSKDEDSKLRDVLGAWEVSPPPAPRFNAAVWQRIAVGQVRSSRGVWVILREWLFVQLPKPVYAAALLVVTAVLSVTAANVRAGHMREEYRIAYARQYLASIDPLAMSAASGRLLR